MWIDERGVEYNERELRVMLYNLGMQYPAVTMEYRNIIEFRGYTFRKLREAGALYAAKAA